MTSRTVGMGENWLAAITAAFEMIVTNITQMKSKAKKIVEDRFAFVEIETNISM